MQIDDDWLEYSRPARLDVEATGMSLIRIALLFSSAAIAIAMLVAPLLSIGQRHASIDGPTAGLDTMSTGSVRNGNRYIVRRSVLQPGGVCIVHENGSRTGSC